MNDPLAQFRRSPQVPPPGAAKATTPPKAPDEYVAFGTKDRVARLRIRRATEPTHSPAYSTLWNVVYDGPQGTNFILYYGFLMVFVQGRNLQSLVFAIEGGLADFIQEFDASRWEKPKDDTAAFIESIKVDVQEGGLPPNTQH